jgi:hypothetical protein
LATQRSVAEKTKTFLIAGLLKDKGVYENRTFLIAGLLKDKGVYENRRFFY